MNIRHTNWAVALDMPGYKDYSLGPRSTQRLGTYLVAVFQESRSSDQVLGHWNTVLHCICLVEVFEELRSNVLGHYHHHHHPLYLVARCSLSNWIVDCKDDKGLLKDFDTR